MSLSGPAIFRATFFDYYAHFVIKNLNFKTAKAVFWSYKFSEQGGGVSMKDLATEWEGGIINVRPGRHFSQLLHCTGYITLLIF